MDECKHPFVPPAGGPAMEGVSGNGVKWAVYDTFCRNFGPEEKARTDRAITEILLGVEQRKLLAERTGKRESDKKGL